MEIINKAIHSQEEVLGWLVSLENHDKVIIEKHDGNKIEATARRELSVEEMYLETTIRLRNSMWFTDVRINGKDINVKH
ncbi:hypothetical protein [Listeria cornellensis]|uniref:Uncharacterized protein n=1 Tax=Listeria cornellensis FSL F6-0969 TaxID=1265820 RepID=W7CA87_9LIST|nr:hypothetical protein [Listeria cornellensis]EUJ29618.1 hypothetical protein PCORN_10747 [Listeria cornellensis FSL F6-0969]